MATDASGNAIPVNSQGVRYYAYGAVRSGDPADLQTDRTLRQAQDTAFTGQKADETGLMFFEARYYDGALGTFLSPDTLVPEPGRAIDYNRFAFVRGNPLKFSDPSGHRICDIDCQLEHELTSETDIHFGENYSGDCWGQTCQAEAVEKVLPKEGTRSVSLSGSAGMGVDVVASLGLVHADSDGNIVVGSLSLGGGGNNGLSVDGGVTYMATNASSVDQLGGWYVNAGACVGEGVGVCDDFVGGTDTNTNKKIVGNAITYGAAARLALPAPPIEVHGNANYTWLSPLQINLYDWFGLPRPRKTGGNQ